VKGETVFVSGAAGVLDQKQ